MGLNKVLTDSNTGVPMAYHVVINVNAQYLNDSTYITFACFFNKDAYTNGLRPLHQDQILLPGVPPQNADVLDWVQEQLIVPVDDTLNTNAFVNRWMFAGGTVADHSPQIPAPVAAPVVETPVDSAEDAGHEAPLSTNDTPASVDVDADPKAS